MLPACLPACLLACLHARRWRGAQRCLLDDAAAHCMPLIPRMGGGELGTLLWSFATMRHVHPGGQWSEQLRQAAKQRDLTGRRALRTVAERLGSWGIR